MNELDLIALAEVFEGRPWILCAFIFLSTFILEDVATVSAALLSSYGHIMPEAAYVCLLLGIILGDLGLYGLGFAATKTTWSSKLLERKKVALVQNWLSDREIMSILAARFVPGARLPTYTAMGFFKLSFSKFIITVFVASVLWTSILFFAIYTVGEIFIDELEQYRLPVAIIMIALVIIAPKIVKLIRNKKT